MNASTTGWQPGRVPGDVTPVRRAQSRPMESSGPPSADEELMLAFGRGDVRAFEMLYDRHERGLFRFIVRCVGRQAGNGVAEELFQDTWFAVTREAGRYRPQARFATWLYTIARSRVVDHVRRSRSRGGTPASIDDEAHADLARALAADARGEPLARVEDRARATAFMAAVDALPDEQRAAFLLQVEAGLSVEEIGAATGVGAETAKSRLRYARAKLRQALAHWR